MFDEIFTRFSRNARAINMQIYTMDEKCFVYTYIYMLIKSVYTYTYTRMRTSDVARRQIAEFIIALFIGNGLWNI